MGTSNILSADASVATMITLHLHSSITDHSASLGPSSEFRLYEHLLCEGPRSRIAMTRRSTDWMRGATAYNVIECRESVCVRFADWDGHGTNAPGPLDEFTITDRLLYSGEEVIAKFYRSCDLWLCFQDGTFWPIMVIEACGADKGNARRSRRAIAT